MSFKLKAELISYINEWEKKINAFIELKLNEDEGAGIISPAGEILQDDPEKQAAKSLLDGLPFAAADNIAVKCFLYTNGSRLLEQFHSPFSATVVQKLEKAGGFVIGKTNLDEFGMGCTGSSALKQTHNPWDLNRVPGGSSGGGAAAVAAGIVPYALGIDSNGSVRQGAAFCGIPGLKSGYGSVSRNGLTAYASSLDAAGIFADNIARLRAVYAIVRGKDPMDQTSSGIPAAAQPLYPATTGIKKTIGVLMPQTAAPIAAPEAEVCRAFDLAKERLTAMGHKLVDIDIPSLKYSVPAFYTIAAAEAASNLTRFDGIRFGSRSAEAENPDELIDKSREAGFGDEVKLQILLGSFVLRSGYQEQYFNRARKIRETIKAAFVELLGDSEYTKPGKIDAILMPVYPRRAFGIGELSSFDQKAADVYTCCANLAGLPALSFPVSAENGLPAGVQLLGRAFAEGVLLDIAEDFEKQFPFPHPAAYRAFWS